MPQGGASISAAALHKKYRIEPGTRMQIMEYGGIMELSEKAKELVAVGASIIADVRFPRQGGRG